ncbi:MAG: 23S rRNA (uracil(1939)-C(5))-methyltransferase RlmD [Clostridia bacterium]|nr:23S rRNA (uracil(1939)-C(5))-methyltransferase RlmD [Clostridia bacterium]
MKIDKMKKKLFDSLGEERYNHTIMTAEAAVRLAKIYGCDEKKAEIAGLLHDCAKHLDTEIQKQMLIDENNLQELEKVPKVLHGPAGVIVAKEEYGIEDEEILNAIKYHVFGRADMTLLEKIIFIADAIEESREFPGVKNLRKIAKTDLDMAVLMSLDGTRQKAEDDKLVWYKGSKEALDYYSKLIKIWPGAHYEVHIDNMTHEGRGVARIDGFVVFVDGAITGEDVEIEVVYKTKSYAIANIYKIIHAVEERVEPFCKVYSKCGGCSMQHLRYNIQLKFKENYVKDCIKRIGGFSKADVAHTKGMKFPYKYRNKVQYPVSNGRAGFYMKRSNTIVEHRLCAIQPDDVNEIMNYSKAYLNDDIRHVVFRSGTEGIMMIIVSAKANPELGSWINDLMEKFGNIKSVVLNINTKETNTILGDKNIALYGDPFIMDRLLGIDYIISPNSFYQVNKEQTKYLYQTIGRLAALTGKEMVYDLYCGVGSIGMYLAKKAGNVIGVESVGSAVKDARINAKNNNLKNIKFELGLAEEVAGELKDKHGKPDVVVVDPPRKGCERVLLDTIIEMGPQKIIYVSCDPATMARDLKILCDNTGYSIGKVQPVDMFPFTSHVETVVLMSRV